MTYNKAEIRVLGEAAAVIQDLSKDQNPVSDFADPTRIGELQPAYGLDE